MGKEDSLKEGAGVVSLADPPLANPADMDIPRCVDGADEAIALIRAHHSSWQKEKSDSHA